MKNKKVLVLAGGTDQIALIKELKKNNCYVYLLDYFENPPAKDVADEFLRISTLDIDAVLNYAISKSIDLITTACTDQALLTVASVSEKLSLPFYLSAKQARNVTNKYYMKKLFADNDINTADCITLTQNDGISELTNISYPCVVKPADCNSSKGVQKVENHDGLRKALNIAFSYSRSNKAIIEKYIDGKEISVDLWVYDGNPLILSMTESMKLRRNDGLFTIYQSVYPVVLSEHAKNNICIESEKICRAFGIQNGPMMMQILVNDDSVYVVEFSPRMGGGSKYKLIEYITGINIMSMYVQFILGDTLENVEVKHTNKQIEFDYLYTKPGIVTRVNGFDSLKSKGLIKEFFLYKKIGTTIDKIAASSDRMAGMLLEADSKAELKDIRDYILSHSSIMDEYGSDILYRDCFK